MSGLMNSQEVYTSSMDDDTEYLDFDCFRGMEAMLIFADVISCPEPMTFEAAEVANFKIGQLSIT